MMLVSYNVGDTIINHPPIAKLPETDATNYSQMGGLLLFQSH